jgi:hypothetical protein
MTASVPKRVLPLRDPLDSVGGSIYVNVWSPIGDHNNMRRATERLVLTVSEGALRGGHMMTRRLHGVIWLVVAGLLVYLSLPGVA